MLCRLEEEAHAEAEEDERVIEEWLRRNRKEQRVRAERQERESRAYRQQDQWKQNFKERWRQKQRESNSGGGGGGSDSWAVLGLRPGATKKEIKVAFRKKAFDCHPDRHPDDPKAMEKFKELCEAYEALTKR